MASNTVNINSAKPAAKEAAAQPAAKPASDTGLGPNEKFPFGIKFTKDGNISWERFKTEKERTLRLGSLKADTDAKPVNYGKPPAAREAAKPAAKKAAQPAAKKAAQPAAKKAAAQPAAKPAAAKDVIALHLNKTGRLCFLKDATARLAEIGIEDNGKDYFVEYAVERGIIRLDVAKKAGENTLPIRFGAGRPYVSATKIAKEQGFEPNTDSRDIDAKPYGKAGFQFRLA